MQYSRSRVQFKALVFLIDRLFVNKKRLIDGRINRLLILSFIALSCRWRTSSKRWTCSLSSRCGLPRKMSGEVVMVDGHDSSHRNDIHKTSNLNCFGINDLSCHNGTQVLSSFFDLVLF